jgi:hypothetical protein
MWMWGAEKSSGSSPRPGEKAVWPQSQGRSSRTSICSTSPGRAPATLTGPVSGWPLNSRLPTSAAVEWRV